MPQAVKRADKTGAKPGQEEFAVACERKAGANNFARINSSGGGDVVNGNDYAYLTTALDFSPFEYTISIIDGTVNYIGTDLDTNTQAFNLSYSDASIDLANLSALQFRAHNTTGAGPVWLDDLQLTLHTKEVPAPASALLLGLGLAGLGFRRRKVR